MTNGDALRLRQLREGTALTSNEHFLLMQLSRYEHMLNWNVTCKNCANLLDRLYSLDCVLDQIKELAHGAR